MCKLLLFSVLSVISTTVLLEADSRAAEGAPVAANTLAEAHSLAFSAKTTTDWKKTPKTEFRVEDDSAHLEGQSGDSKIYRIVSLLPETRYRFSATAMGNLTFTIYPTNEWSSSRPKLATMRLGGMDFRHSTTEFTTPEGPGQHLLSIHCGNQSGAIRELVFEPLGAAAKATQAPEFSVHAVFGDHMVLLRDRPIKISGYATASTTVEVSLEQDAVTVSAAANGEWLAILPARPAGGPFTLTVAGDDRTITFQDVLVGEVWMCSGQSNMQMPVDFPSPHWRTNNSKEEVKNGNHPELRMFIMDRETAPMGPRTEAIGTGWLVCSPNTVGRFSAVAYFFGRQLLHDLRVPIGLIHSSWGGSPIESWISQEGFQAGNYAPELQKISQARLKPDELAAQFPDEVARDNARKALWKPGHPATLFNSLIAPWLRYPVRGIVWYQGESNAHAYQKYWPLHQLLIADWRRAWDCPDLAFVFVQLAALWKTNLKNRLPNDFWVNFPPTDDALPNMREVQAATLRVPHTGMAVTIDIGDHSDVHPHNKQDVGYRLAKEAERVCYGSRDVTAGPYYAGMEVDGHKVVLSFTNVGSGLRCRGESLGAFAIAGLDGKFVWAQAAIVEDKVEVWSDQVPNPTAVRYAWARYPGNANLFNAEGFPACPFRTDTPDYLK